jgi:hypothetical protein
MYQADYITEIRLIEERIAARENWARFSLLGAIKMARLKDPEEPIEPAAAQDNQPAPIHSVHEPVYDLKQKTTESETGDEEMDVDFTEEEDNGEGGNDTNDDENLAFIYSFTSISC